MTETDAKQRIQHLFAFGDVVVQAFKEQQGRTSEMFAAVEPAVMPYSLTPTAIAVQGACAGYATHRVSRLNFLANV
jgi:hypothetical protein